MIEPGKPIQNLLLPLSQVANSILLWLRRESPGTSLLFCPTEYCNAMAVPSVAGSVYLKTLGGELDQEIPVLWTGASIIAESITPDSLREATTVLKRKLILWDNLYANDYDSRRLYLGPYLGRAASWMLRPGR